jgi:hypothetical protein
MPPLYKQRQKTDYKRPRFLNAVSVVLMLAAGAAVYVAYSLWPVYSLRSEVDNELAGALPDLWRYNLRPDEVAVPELVKIKQRLFDRLREVGVKDPKLAISLIRGQKVVAVEARFTTTAVFPWWEKRIDFTMTPRAETDAARIKW